MKGTATAQIRLPGDVLLYTKGLIIAENFIIRLMMPLKNCRGAVIPARLDHCMIRNLHLVL